MPSLLPLTLVGGARVGKVHCSWPFARLAIGQHKLVLETTIAKDYAFTVDETVEVVVERHPFLGFATGIRILHTQPGTPELLVSWYLRTQKLKGLLEATDFSVKMGELTPRQRSAQ